MVQALANLVVADGDPVSTEHIATALTAGSCAGDVPPAVEIRRRLVDDYAT
jgi:hypothetical protein